MNKSMKEELRDAILTLAEAYSHESPRGLSIWTTGDGLLDGELLACLKILYPSIRDLGTGVFNIPYVIYDNKDVLPAALKYLGIESIPTETFRAERWPEVVRDDLLSLGIGVSYSLTWETTLYPL